MNFRNEREIPQCESLVWSGKELHCDQSAEGMVF